MTVKFTSLALAVLLVLPVMCATSNVHEILVVGTALDGGAAYDYIEGKPDYSAGHPFIPFSHRHRTLLLASGISLTLAVRVGVSAAFLNRRGAQASSADGKR